MNLQQYKFIFYILIIASLPIAGYVIMRGLSYTFFTSTENAIWLAIFMVLIIVIGLVVPYLMLKLWFHAAHLRDKHEKDISLKDLPKDANTFKK
jgi:hypothetical protein